MSLELYNKKRNFGDTPEPEGKKKENEGELIFVVQRHQASHLHFDFRLESGGALKSWAVPKGPSMNHSDKRLAVMVEDHPLDYATFEGVIPEGNYGAGIVEIWDSGTWNPLDGFEDTTKAIDEGQLEFVMLGKKLKGKFALVEMKKSKVRNGWLLIKKNDEFTVNEEYDANKE